jgi:hypothetical protein
MLIGMVELKILKKRKRVVSGDKMGIKDQISKYSDSAQNAGMKVVAKIKRITRAPASSEKKLEVVRSDTKKKVNIYVPKSVAGQLKKGKTYEFTAEENRFHGQNDRQKGQTERLRVSQMPKSLSSRNSSSSGASRGLGSMGSGAGQGLGGSSGGGFSRR